MAPMRGVLIAALLIASCSEEAPLETPDKEVCLTRRDGARYCIDMYEASRRDSSATSQGDDIASPPRSLPDLRPWTQITWAAARTACESKGKRLCERDEWIDACDGVVGEGGLKYNYGDEIMPALCNTEGSGPEVGGEKETCKSTTGVFDQSGNVWEWTGNSAPAARGGGWTSNVFHECVSGDDRAIFPGTAVEMELGFRCCRDSGT